MDKLLCLLYWRVFVQNVFVFVKETSWRRCQLWCRLPVSSTWLFSKTDKNEYGLYVQKTKQSITCVKGGKMVDCQDDESCLVSTLCPANMQIWVNGVIWGVVQGWEGKCKIANLSFILTPRHFRPLWGWAMMSTSAWYRCLRQHCRPIAIKSDQAFYVRQDYSVSILNLLKWYSIEWS